MAKRKKKAAVSKASAAPVIRDNWSVSKQLAWWSVLAMVFMTPIAVSNMSFIGGSIPLSYDQFDIIKVFIQRVFTFAALAFWVWDIMMRGGKIRRTPVEWLILAFLAWVTISTVLSIHPPTAFFGKYRRFEGLASFLNYGIMYFLVLQLADNATRIKRLAQTIFWSGIVVGAYGLAQALGHDPMAWGQLPFEANRSFSTYGNPDLLGGFLMFGAFVSLGLALAESNLVWRGIYWFGFLMNAAVIVTAFTRSAWIGSLVGFFFITLLAIRQRTDWKAEDWAFSGTAAAVAGTFIIRSFSNPNEVMNFGKRVASIVQFGEGSAKTRFEIWAAAWAAIKDRPIFGFGPDTFRLIFPKYKPVEYVKDAGFLSVADNVHNYPLQLASGIGVPGMFMLYGIFGWVAVRAWKVVGAREGQNRMVLAGFWAACAAYIAHLLFGLSVTGSSFLLWVSMAALMSPTATVIAVRPPSWGVIVGLLAAVFAVAGISYMFVYMQADKAYLMARIGTRGTQRTEYAQKAVRLNPWNDMYRAEVGLAITDEAITAISSAQAGDQANAQAAFSAFQRAEASLKETIAFVPWEYDNYVFLANLYNLGGQFFDPKYYEQAVAIGEKGKEVEPFGPAIRLQLSRALVSLGRTDEAIKELEIATKMDPAYTDAIMMLVGLYEQKGQKEQAILVLKRANEWAVGQAGVAEKLAALEGTATPVPTPTP